MKCFCIMFNYVTCDKLRSGFFMPFKLFCLFKFRFNLKLIKRFHEHRSEVWINFVPEKPCIRMAILNHGSTFFSQMFLMRLLKAFSQRKSHESIKLKTWNTTYNFVNKRCLVFHFVCLEIICFSTMTPFAGNSVVLWIWNSAEKELPACKFGRERFVSWMRQSSQ